MKRIMISAGEASGDMHAANIIKALRTYNEEIEFYGMGSQQLRDAGANLLVDSSDIAVVGIVEVLFHYNKIIKALNILRESLRSNPPDLLVLVDYQEFNFKLAETAKELGIKVLFYISPQIWAWRPKRVYKIGKIIDMMAVILPFEERYYKEANVPVRFVGNPLVDKAKADKDKQSCMTEFNLDSDKTVVGLFPGSRRGEIQRILPLQLAAAEIIKKDKVDCQFILPIASSLNEALFTDYLQAHSHLDIKLVKDLPYNVIQCCDAIISASGTATLEIALMGIPYCISYKVATLSYLILRPLIKIDRIGLVNIIAGKDVVKEFIQFEAKPQAIADEINLILDNNEYREKMIKELNDVRNLLGKTGGSDNMAKLILEMLA